MKTLFLIVLMLVIVVGAFVLGSMSVEPVDCSCPSLDITATFGAAEFYAQLTAIAEQDERDAQATAQATPAP